MTGKARCGAAVDELGLVVLLVALVFLPPPSAQAASGCNNDTGVCVNTTIPCSTDSDCLCNTEEGTCVVNPARTCDTDDDCVHWQLPIYWCALEGTDLAHSPIINTELWKLHEAADDVVFMPQADITFRTAFGIERIQDSTWKTIPDPDPEPGGPGDVEDSEEQAVRVQKECLAAYRSSGRCADGRLCETWRGADPCEDQSECVPFQFNGTIAVYINEFVDKDGKDTSPGAAKGKANLGAPNQRDLCADPPGRLGRSWQTWVLQEQSVRGLDREGQGKQMGHELGHALYLGHGNGIDDDGDRRIDERCDQADEGDGSANACNDPVTLMIRDGCGKDRSIHLTDHQVKQARAAAAGMAGAMDPPGAIPGPVAGDVETDSLEDVPRSDVDLMYVNVQHDSDQDLLLFSHSVAGLAEGQDIRRYVVFADLDADPSTGGSPAAVGFPTDFVGAELIAQVTLVWREEFGLQPIDRVWTFEAGAFEVSSDLRIWPTLETISEAETSRPIYSVISVQVPSDVTGPFSIPLRFQAIAEVLPPALDAGVLDRLPDASDGRAFASLSPPIYPECSTAPFPAAPGGRATVGLTGLAPSEPVHVILGIQEVAKGATDDSGAAEIEFRVPVLAPSGLRLVTVGVEGTALTADCSLLVSEGGRISLTPEASVNEVGVQHTVTATVRSEAGDPQAGVVVEFGVDAGPNAGRAGECSFNADCTTDEDGRVFFTYTGDAGFGVDQISASFVDEDGSRIASNTALKFWDTDCNQNGVADTCDLDCAAFDGLCDVGFVGFCGMSADGNRDGVPDECNEPPDCTNAGAEPQELWPPNHKFRDITIAGVTDPDGDPVAVTITGISQDEAVEGRGDGRTSPDGSGIGSPIAQVRSERAGGREVPGDGRVYHVSFSADDGQGGTCMGEVSVCVPHDMRPGRVCVDGGRLFDSTEDPLSTGTKRSSRGRTRSNGATAP